MPHPLYNLNHLYDQPDAPVLIVEGEKTANAANDLFPDYVPITSPTGSKSASKADWLPLKGRHAVIWPDADEAGLGYAQSVADQLHKIGAKSIKVVELPEGLPKGWDLADPPPKEWDPNKRYELIKNSVVIDESQNPSSNPAPPDRNGAFRVDEKGVWHRTLDKNGNLEEEWICSPLDVLARTRNLHGADWGRLLRVTDADGRVHEWAMPMSMTSGDGSEYRAHLKSLGLDLTPGRRGKNLLELYLVTARPAQRARCVDRIGWHDRTFVLPDRTYGEISQEQIVMQTASADDNPFRTKGELGDWQREVATYCMGNSRLIFAVSCALAAPLIHLAGTESGGFHFLGPSSVGKSTALHVAGSVWGGGDINGYLRTWRATSNGLEALTQQRCDSLFCLDEMSQVEGNEAGQIAYMLANGEGKSRARRNGSGRTPCRWRILFLSSGEVSLADKMSEVGRRISAGQEVRLVDIPADAGIGLGLFEELHGFVSAGALADHLRQASQRYYGSTIRALLAHLASDLDWTGEHIRKAQQQFISMHCPMNAAGQVKRVAARFGLVAFAGELAISTGTAPWGTGIAEQAAVKCFIAWLEQRDGAGPSEITKGIAQVREFIEKHGEARFTPLEYLDEGPGYKTINRAGFKRLDDNGKWEYLVLKEAWTKEVCQGFDYKQVCRALIDCGLMQADLRRFTRKVRIPNIGSTDVYFLNSTILGEAECNH